MNINPNKDNITVSRITVNKTIIITKDDMELILEKTIRQTDTIKIISWPGKYYARQYLTKIIQTNINYPSPTLIKVD